MNEASSKEHIYIRLLSGTNLYRAELRLEISARLDPQNTTRQKLSHAFSFDCAENPLH
jgi:hypothetical protein